MKLLTMAILSIAALLITTAASLSMTTRASAFDPFGQVCTASNNSPTCQQKRAQQARGTNPVVDIINKAVDLIAVVAGVASVVVIIVSGIVYITAGGSGDPSKTKTARSALIGAAIGLVIIALSWTIINIVLSIVG